MASSLNGTGVSFSDGTSQASAWVGLKSQLFTASGTFTVPTGVTSVKVTCIGGGSGYANAYGPGAAGGCAIGVYTVTPGASITVTVGAGSANGTTSGTAGTSSFGAFCSATGGTGRAASQANGGIGSGGNIQNIRPNLSSIYNTITLGSFTGSNCRAANSTQAAAIAWSVSLEGVSNTQGASSPSISLVPGTAGYRIDVGCSSFSTGGVGGAVLVEW